MNHPWRETAMARRRPRSVASSPSRSASRAAAGSWASGRSRRRKRRRSNNNNRISVVVDITGRTTTGRADGARETPDSAAEADREVEEPRNPRTEHPPTPTSTDPTPTSTDPTPSGGAPRRRCSGATAAVTPARTPRGTPRSAPEHARGSSHPRTDAPIHATSSQAAAPGGTRARSGRPRHSTTIPRTSKRGAGGSGRTSATSSPPTPRRAPTPRL